MTVREVHLYGAKAETFLLNVESPAEAVRAMMTLRPGLREHFRENNWSVVIGPLDDGYAVDERELSANAGRQPIHLIPEVELAGGLFRSGIGKIIIGAVLIAAAVFAAPALFSAAALAAGTIGGIVQSAVLGMGISMVLGGTAMLLSPTPKGPKATEQANPEERASFFFNGPVNISEQGAPIPLIYGYFRAGSIVVNVGLWNENLSAEEIEGGASTMLMARMVNPNAIPDGTMPESRIYPNQPELQKKEQALLAKGGGKGASTGAAYTPREAPNSLGSRSYVRIHEVLCEGGIAGPRTWPNWGQAVFFDDTPLQGSSGAYNFKLSFAWLRGGWPTEGPIPGFPSSENTVNVGVEVKYGTPVIRRVTSLQTTLIRLQIRVPQLMYQHPNGDIIETGVDVQVDYQVAGQPWTYVFWDRILGKTTTGYERSYSFWLPPRDGREIDIRVTRLSINSGDVTPGKAFNDTYWSSFVEMIDGQMLHNTEASMAFAVDAEQFPSIPKRSYEFDWLIIAIPTNYDPRSRSYVGDWDGNFKWEWSNNPAWVLYDLLTHPTRGLGRDLSGGIVDKWSFYAAAQYNDEMVPDGFGGYEPRFTFNGILNTQEEAINVLQAVASCFRAQFYVAGGVLYLAQDRPNYAYSRVFAPSNIVNGTFDYQSTEQKSRATAVNVNWIDPAQGWLPQIEPVLYPDKLGRFGYREIPLSAYGCTSRGQAIRAGRYFLFGAHHEQEIISFVVGLENADLRPGDIIATQDPSRASVDWSGRVVEVTGDPLEPIVTLDRATNMTAGGIFFSSFDPVTFKTKTFRAVIQQWITASQIKLLIFVLDGVPEGVVTPDSIWALEGTTVALRQWRVLSVAEQEGLQFQVSATFHDPAKYPFVEYNIPVPEVSYSALPTGPLMPPSDLAAVDYYTLDPQGSPLAGIIFSWTPPPDSRVIQYVGDVHGPGRAPQHYTSIPGTTLSLTSADTGEWTLYVKSADAVGRRSVAVSVVFNTATSARIPLPPFNFTARQEGHAAYLQWNIPDDLSISYWWLKWTPETDPVHVFWDAAITVQGTIPLRSISIVVPAQTGTFLLKSVSVRGKESATFAAAIISMADIRPYGAYRAEQPAWVGTKTNFTVVANELVLDVPDVITEVQPPPPVGFFRHPKVGLLSTPIGTAEYITDPLSLTQRAQVLSKVLLAGRGVVTADIMSNWIPLAVAVPLTRTTSADWDAEVDERYRLADGVAWSDWRPAMAGEVITKDMQYRLRAASYTQGTDVKFTRMEEWLMLPAHEQTGTNVTDANGIRQVQLNPDYYMTPEVHVQPVGSTGAFLYLTDVTPTTFTVKSILPGGAVAPNLNFTWTAYGYGRLP